MRRRRSARGGVVVAALVVAGCGFDPGRIPDVDDCRKVTLTVERVDGMAAENVVLAARLTTADGRPVAGELVRFDIRENDDVGILWGQTARTGYDGRAAVDLADTIRRVQTAREAFGRSRILRAEYVNPAEVGRAPAPGFCSTEARVPFEPRR